MKSLKWINFSQMMAGILFLTISIGFAPRVFSQTSMEYTDAEVAQFETDLKAGTYDIYILTSSGGIYDLNYPSVSKTTTIKGKDDLLEKPVLKFTANTGSANSIIRVNGSAVRDTVVFENLEFDGSGAATPPIIVKSDNEAHLVFRNCYLHGMANNNGAIRMNTAGTSILIENSLFADGLQRMILPYTTGAVYGDVTIRNCTFTGITGEIVYFRSAGGVFAEGNNVTIDHCTFYNVGKDITRLDQNLIYGVISVTNSIFEQVGGPIKADIIDYNYLAGMTNPPDGTNTITTAPVFADAAALNFTLTNKDDLTGGDFQILGDLSWYDDVYPPRISENLIKADQTHVIVTFNEMVDETSATTLTNYVLSGTAGLTGNPSEAVLSENGKEVILTVGDMSAMQVGETVIVTVSNVTDILGNAITENNVATYTLLDETPPIVTMAAQAATNDAGQNVVAQSNETGKIYLIHSEAIQSSVEDFDAAVFTFMGSVVEVTIPDADVSVSTSGLKVGDYYAYAVDAYDNISEKSANAVTVADITAPAITMDAQEANNSVLGKIFARSSEPGTIYLVLEGEVQATVADFEAAISAGKGASAEVKAIDTDVTVSTNGLEPGMYYGYAVDETGNISAKSSNAATIVQFVPRVRYYNETEAGALEDDLLSALDGDVFILTSSGGRYVFSKYVNITAKVIIEAAEDVAKRPVLTIYRENNTVQTLRLYADGSSITVRGIEFDSESRAAGSYPIKYAVRTQPDIGHYSFVAEDCYFHGVWGSNDGGNGSTIKLYNGTWGDSIIFRNCIFEGDEGIVLTNTGTEFGWDKFEITNCTFMNIPDEQALEIAQRGPNKNLPLEINHCTFYNVGGIAAPAIRTDSLYTVNLSNSIFSATATDSSWQLWGDGTDKSMVDYTNFFEAPLPMTDMGGVVGSSIWTDDPQFADPANGDLMLGNQAMYTLGSDGLPLGDLRWADIFGPKVRPVMTARSDSTLLIKFNEWIDTTTAVVAANYQLSGSAGYTGSVKKAELYNFYSVLLTVESFVNQAGKEIIVTVVNVGDLKGNVVDNSENIASYIVEEFRPVVTAAAQDVTNGTGQVVIAQSNQGVGMLYIVLDGEPQTVIGELDAAVSAKKGAKTTVTAAYTDTEIDVYAITPGTYYAYATDESGNISEKGTNPIVVTDGIPPIVSIAVQSAGNGDAGFVIAQSNELGKLYIILDGEPAITENDLVSSTYVKKGKRANVTEVDTDVQISTTDLVPGIYYAYAVDVAGNVSEKGASPLNITDVTGIYPELDGMMKIFAYDKKVIVETYGSDATSILIRDILGRTVVDMPLTSERSEFRLNSDGIYLVTLVREHKMLRTVKIIIH